MLFPSPNGFTSCALSQKQFSKRVASEILVPVLLVVLSRSGDQSLTQNKFLKCGCNL